MNRIEALANKMCTTVQQPTAMRWLRHGLYGVVIYNVLFLALPLADLLWGAHSLVMPFTFPDLPTNDFIMLLHDPRYSGLYPIFMALPVLGVLLYLFKGYTRLSALLVYIGVVVLFNRVFLYLTGGNYLLHIMLFYLLWMDERQVYSGRKADVSNVLSNFALWACRIQLIIVYLYTGMFKLAGEAWRSGEAVYLITHVDEYTLPWFEHSIAEVHWLMVVANYFALAYFFTFPIFVWTKRWKIPLLILGVLFHLGLGIVLGVFDFSLVMIVSYAAFLNEESIQKIKSWLPVKKRAVTHP